MALYSLNRILANGKLGRAKEPFTANADQFGSDIAAVVADVPAAGAVSLCAIATELTARRIKTRRGGCAFHGRWASIPRDRWHLFHGIPGSPSRRRWAADLTDGFIESGLC